MITLNKRKINKLRLFCININRVAKFSSFIITIFFIISKKYADGDMAIIFSLLTVFLFMVGLFLNKELFEDYLFDNKTPSPIFSNKQLNKQRPKEVNFEVYIDKYYKYLDQKFISELKYDLNSIFFDVKGSRFILNEDDLNDIINYLISSKEYNKEISKRSILREYVDGNDLSDYELKKLFLPNLKTTIKILMNDGFKDKTMVYNKKKKKININSYLSAIIENFELVEENKVQKIPTKEILAILRTNSIIKFEEVSNKLETI